MKYVLYAALVSLVACSGGSDNSFFSEYIEPEPQFLSINNPTVSLPPDVGAPLNFGIFDLAAEGYEEQEYLLSGTATAFSNVSELGGDGQWTVEPGEQADYTTRALVRRPINSADFSGTVIVEWLNVSSGFDTNPEWDSGHVEMVREGHAWVGVTAQFVGVNGREGGIVPLHLKALNPVRYEALEHPGDSFSYDIFSQIAQSLRTPDGEDMLNGLQPELLIAAGESQSAFRLTTYVNAIQPLYNPYNAYLIHSRGQQATPLAQDPQELIGVPDAVFIRTDLNVPVLVFQTETDLLLPSLNSVAVRQDDNDILRYWEVTGTAHADRYSLQEGRTDTGVDPRFAAVDLLDNVNGFIQCDSPVNSGPMHYVFAAAINHLNTWARGGDAPPMGDPMEIASGDTAFVLDNLGNVLGGIRTPYVDAPSAILSGLGQTGASFCGLFGTTELFDAATMASLYVDQAGFVSAVTEATEAAVDSGFLLRADANQIIAWAPQQWDRQVP
ncbi:MAG: alpha/beta hydrolase domain-containing protein [Pseudomonadales bacterium]